MQGAQLTTTQLDQAFITSVVPNTLFYGAPFESQGLWTVDSRTVQPGDVFVALPGSNTDGHEFVEDALTRGARVCIMSHEWWPRLEHTIKKWSADRTYVIVPDPRDALFALATHWRSLFAYPLIGVTGSVGKTTTKELIAKILRASGAHVIASTGNQNSCLGLALNIMRMRPEHTHAVFEMGISTRGEMQQLTQLVKPTTAVITTLAHSHMEGLGSLPDIAAEKRAIFHSFPEQGIGIIHGDQPLLSAVAYKQPIIKFGCKTVHQVQARKIRQTSDGIHFTLKLYHERHAVQLASNNLSRVYNALAAIAVTHSLGIASQYIIPAIQEPLNIAGRFEKKRWGLSNHVLIDDSYNANPESMKSALTAFEKMDGQQVKIAVLGDMREMGVTSAFWHRQIVRFLRKTPSLEYIILVGQAMEAARKAVPHHLAVTFCQDWQEATAALRTHLAEYTSCVLVKASHGVGLHLLVDTLTQELSCERV